MTELIIPESYEPDEPLPYLTTWNSHGGYMHWRDDGTCEMDAAPNVDSMLVLLPNLKILWKRALWIANGGLVDHRFTDDFKAWSQAVEDYPGSLQCEWRPGQDIVTRADKSVFVPSLRNGGWFVSFREAGDPEYSLNFSGTYMAPEFALAWMIAVTEEHDREARAEMLQVGGLA